MIPSASWGVVFITLGNLFRRFLFTCRIQLLLYSSNLSKYLSLNSKYYSDQGTPPRRLEMKRDFLPQPSVGEEKKLCLCLSQIDLLLANSIAGHVL